MGNNTNNAMQQHGGPLEFRAFYPDVAVDQCKQPPTGGKLPAWCPKALAWFACPCQQQCWHRLHFAQHPHIDELLRALFFLRGDVWIGVDLQTWLPGLLPEHSASISLMTFLCPPRSRSWCQLSGLWNGWTPLLGAVVGRLPKDQLTSNSAAKRKTRN